MTIARAEWPHLLSLVEQALDLPEDRREHWVASIDLPEVLRSALRRLLEDRRAIETDNFLGALPAVSVGDADIAGPSQITTGTLIGPYRLLRELGQGGMSTVWLAERADEQLKRPVALKLPHAGPGQELLARRLLRERKILAELAHPHIARLYDVGLTESGMPYLVMEFVDGQTLLAHADAQRLTIAQRVALFQQVLSAVQYAHGKLVLHRDLKPSNILVTPGGEVKLLDFGIAKVMADDAGAGDQTELTRAADRRLTPSYASPEQLLGQSLSTASDVYSLGVILYELLCGERPHSTTTGSAAQLEAAVLNDEPRPPSRRMADDGVLSARGMSSNAMTKTLRGDLDAIVIKCLAKSPMQRYPSAEALGADLSHWLAGEPVTARSPGAWVYFSKFVKRHTLSVSLGSGAVAALVVVSAVALVQSRTARQEAERAATARDFLLQLFEEAAPDRLGGVNLTAMQLLEQGRQKAQARLGDQARLQAELLAGIGEAQYQVHDMTGADAALGQAANYFRAAGDNAKEAAARLTRLQIAIHESNFNVVDGLLRDLEPLATSIRDDRLLYLRWLNAQGNYADLVDNDEAARNWQQQCIDLAVVSDFRQATIAFNARLDLSFVLMDMGEFSAAQTQLTAAESIALSDKAFSEADKTFRLADARASLDFRLERINSLSKWLPVSLAWCEKQFGPYGKKCGVLRYKHLGALLLRGDPQPTRSLVSELNLWLEQETSPRAWYSMALMGAQVLAVNGMTDRQSEPIVILESVVDPEATPWLPVALQMPALVTLSEVALRAGDHARSQKWLSRAEALADSSGGERKTALFHLKLARGLALQSLGKDREALTFMSELCERSPKYLGLSLGRLNCARSLAAIGKTTEASQLVKSELSRLEEALGPDAHNTVRARQLLQALEAPGGYRLPRWDPSQIFLAF